MNDLKTEPPLVAAPLSARIADWIVLLFPRLLGALFLFTAIQKIHQPQPLQAVFAFDGLPSQLVNIAVWSVIAIELILGGMLFAFIGLRRTILFATGCLLMVYIAQLGYLLLQSQASSCGCMGADVAPDEARTTNLLSLVRNLCLLWPVIWVWRQLSPAHKKL